MENVQTLIEQMKRDLAAGKNDEEIFSGLVPLLERDPQTSERLADLMASLPDRLTGRILHRMFDTTRDKKVRKMVKRSLYRLKSKGIEVDETFSDREPPILRPPRGEAGEGYASGIDFLGHRVLWLVLPHAGRGLTVIYGIVSDQQGIVDFSQGEMTRKEFKNFFKEVGEKSPFPMVAIEPSYAACLFAQAYELNLARSAAAPQGYLQAKGEIEKIRKDYPLSLIYSYLQAGDIAGDDRLLAKGGDLLKADLFSTWKIEEEDIRPYADEISEAEESKIVLNPAQKEMRFQGIYQKALSELFSGERKLLYQRRLEETAYVLFKLGREEEAKISLSVAMDLEKPLHPIQPNPFLYQLVTKSILTLLTEAKEKKAKEVSLIVKP